MYLETWLVTPGLCTHTLQFCQLLPLLGFSVFSVFASSGHFLLCSLLAGYAVLQSCSLCGPWGLLEDCVCWAPWVCLFLKLGYTGYAGETVGAVSWLQGSLSGLQGSLLKPLGCRVASLGCMVVCRVTLASPG